ncbi:hypothetical protein RFI_28346 [Reticulomyxa filosa]|uniref:Uncharacterized protein n=1 Tax=Reticulomyxa filosa TaxID=46433 RepID=X6M6F3_RETFI|nr:hypothetical protein RFI_28346 [Reticulomyxa filosa]|eukprot:ETO09042.1 hypothetical protein RFI_28346 [Reticulomyxa filosa]
MYTTQTRNSHLWKLWAKGLLFLSYTKNGYKFICKYPSDAKLDGHYVMKLVDNNSKDSSQITLFSVGFNYVGSNISNKLDKLNNYNKCVPFTDNHNHPIIIGREYDNHCGIRVVIGGSSNHLLFITYYRFKISLFGLSTFQFIKHDKLPTNDDIWYHCFVSKLKNRQG